MIRENWLRKKTNLECHEKKTDSFFLNTYTTEYW